jgi:hypothetical protein
LPTYPSTFLHTNSLGRYLPNPTYMVAPTHMVAIAIDLANAEKNEEKV